VPMRRRVELEFGVVGSLCDRSKIPEYHLGPTRTGMSYVIGTRSLQLTAVTADVTIATKVLVQYWPARA
jgi:hypothetical protein